MVGAEVTVSLTYEPGRAALSARAETVEELRPLAQRVVELPALGEHYAPGSRPALHHLERGLFEPEPAERIDPARRSRCSRPAASWPRPSSWPQQILELLRAGVPGEEIVVVYRSPSAARR